MEHLSNGQKDCPNQYKNSHKLCNDTGHPLVNLMKSQWKLRLKHDQNFPNGGKAVVEQILASEEINESKRARL